MDLQVPIIFDEAELSEFVHEEAHARSCCPNHLGERLLTDLCADGFGPSLLAEIRQQQKGAGQALLQGGAIRKSRAFPARPRAGRRDRRRGGRPIRPPTSAPVAS